MNSPGYSRVAVAASGHSHVFMRYERPIVVAASGASTPMYQCTTSIQCVRRSVSMPPPDALKWRQRRNRSGSNGRSPAGPSQRFQSSFDVSTSGSGPVVASWYQ